MKQEDERPNAGGQTQVAELGPERFQALHERIMALLEEDRQLRRRELNAAIVVIGPVVRAGREISDAVKSLIVDRVKK